MIRFIVKEVEKLMKGSVHEDDLFIAHDDLISTTEKLMITWIRENIYFHHWLLSINGFQNGTPYFGRPVGNIS